MRISDWSSDVCSSDLRDDGGERRRRLAAGNQIAAGDENLADPARDGRFDAGIAKVERREPFGRTRRRNLRFTFTQGRGRHVRTRSEEHTSELQSLMRISYAVFCLKKKKKKTRV